MSEPRATTYRDAGVDIEAGNRLVERIKPIAAGTRIPGVLAGVGGFGALFELPLQRYRHPVLVAGTDGVGTKLKLAIDAGVHCGIGIDLVAMCVNDILAHGAEPLFFLDYFATGRLRLDVAEEVIRSIAAGCQVAGAALVGGETAELPGIYHDSDYDLAGFCVGIVDRDDMIDARKVEPGDTLIGLASSGPHANGYSLIRKVIADCGAELSAPFAGRTLAETLLEPTNIYVKSVRQLMSDVAVHAVAHITGGGLLENIPRVLPSGTEARIDPTSWPRPPIFDWLQTTGGIPESELYRTFNCGIGLVVCVPTASTASAIESLQHSGQSGWVIGDVPATSSAAPRVVLL